MRIRSPTTGDAAAIARCHIAAWQTAYRGMMPDAFLDGLDVAKRAEQWRETLAGAPPRDAKGQQPSSVRVIEDDHGVVQGFVATGPFRDAPSPTCGELWAINLAPEAWGRGLARPLLDAGEEVLRAEYPRAILWVVSANARARRFYEKAGWAWDAPHDKRDDARGFEIHELRYAKQL